GCRARPFPYTTLFRSQRYAALSGIFAEHAFNRLDLLPHPFFRYHKMLVDRPKPPTAVLQDGDGVVHVAPGGVILPLKRVMQPLIDRKSTRLNSSHVKL